MKMMVLLLVGFVVLAVLVACDFTPDVSLATTDNEQPQLELMRAELLALQHLETCHVLTVEELKIRLLPFLGSGLGRSGGGSEIVVAGVERHMVPFEGGFVQRRRCCIQISDIPFYVFTLENQVAQSQGFALASGDSRVGCIFAVVEYGEIDMDIPFMRMFFSLLAVYVAESIYIFNNVTAEDIRAAVERRDEIDHLDARLAAPRSSVPQNAVGPLLRTAWNQREPYWYVINSIYGRQPGNKYLVGCVAVAVAQIMTFHGSPVGPEWTIQEPRNGRNIGSFTDPRNGETIYFRDIRYNWTDIRSARHARSLPWNLQREIGVLMFEVASRPNLNMNYGPAPKGSGAFDSAVPRTFQNMGFHSPPLENYNFSRIRASIDAGRPVYISGSRHRPILGVIPTGSGHAWVIDGYFIQGGVQFVHSNLGWGGTSNGWYRSGVFDTGNVPGATQMIPDPRCSSGCTPGCIPGCTPRCIAGCYLGNRDRPGSPGLTPDIIPGGPVYRYLLRIIPQIARRLGRE